MANSTLAFAVWLHFRNIKVGDPKSRDTWMGALVSQEHMDKVKQYVKYANEDGGTVKCGEGVDFMNLPIENKNVSS